MGIVPVREFLKLTQHDILRGLRKDHDVRFEDDNVVRITYKEMILNRYLLSILDDYPTIPITSKYNVANYYNNGFYISTTINKFLEAAYEDIVNYIVKSTNDFGVLEIMFKKMFKILNSIYNEVVYDNLEYSTSMSILDFLDIQLDKDLLDAMRMVEKEKTEEAVKNTYNILDRNIRTYPSLVKNPIAKGYISGTFNPGQVQQMLASRGFVTEIDNTIFKYPIASSFVLGMKDIYELAAESRTGAKSLYISTTAIQQSEYANREAQLNTMRIQRVKLIDCGNRDYITWNVREYDNGKNDLDNLIGKRYFKEDGTEDIITKNHKHLINTTIKLRSVKHCKLASKDSICSHCLGELAYSFHNFSNVGYYCSTYLYSILTQKLLSTKHNVESASSGTLTLDMISEKFLNVKNKNGYSFKAGMIGVAKKNYKMIIAQKEGYGIKDLTPSLSLNNVIPNMVTRISTIILSVTENGVETQHPINIKNQNRYGSLTHEFLEYIIQHGYELDNEDRYVIDINGWTNTDPFIVLPEVEFSYSNLSKSLQDKFKYMKSEDGGKGMTATTLLGYLFDLVNSKLSINIAILEVIVYGFTVMNRESGNYDLGRFSDNDEVASLREIMKTNSIGAIAAWERVNVMLVSPVVFYGNNSLEHPLDVLLLPNETIANYYGGMESPISRERV